MATHGAFSPDLRDAGGVALVLNGLSRNSSAGPVNRAPGCRMGPRDLARTHRTRKDGCAVDYTERLRRLAVGDSHFLDGRDDRVGSEPGGLDAKTLALVRLAALVAVGGAGPSYGALADAAVDAGATAVEIVDVLGGVIPVVGLPCVVAATPKLALALGYDLNDVVEHQTNA